MELPEDVSILPGDQEVEHSAAYSFYKNIRYFDPGAIVELAVEAGCNGVASTFGVLGLLSRKYAHKLPFIVKINHNELLSYPNSCDQILFGRVEEAWNLGAVAIGATICFGSPESNRQTQEIAEAFGQAPELGMATILWCYTRKGAFRGSTTDYHTAAELTGQANHLGVTLRADLINQKQADTNIRSPIAIWEKLG